jgi:hypothetical protein
VYGAWLGSRSQGTEVQGSGKRVEQGIGFRFQTVGLGLRGWFRVQGSGFRVQGSVFTP